MTYYVCKQCNYKHTFLPLACAKCKGTNFYPLITSEPIGNTSICNGMKIQEDVLKLRIENEQLKEQIEKMKNCLNCEHYHWSNGDDWCDDHYGQPMYDEECKGKWKLKG